MIRENLQALLAQIPSGVQLVAVSKFHPLENILEAYEAGQRIFAESRPQELAEKVSQLDTSKYPGLEWHFIGHLQTNKLKMVLPYVSLVQSVDSVHLLQDIQKWGKANDRIINVLLEVHIGAEETKQGFHEEEVVDLLFDSEKYPNIRFCGLMAMASHTTDESVIDAAVNAKIEILDSARAAGIECDTSDDVSDLKRKVIAAAFDSINLESIEDEAAINSLYMSANKVIADRAEKGGCNGGKGGTKKNPAAQFDGAAGGNHAEMNDNAEDALQKRMVALSHGKKED